VLLADDLDLTGLLEDMIERDDLSRIVERCDRLDVSGSDVDETIGVERLILRSDVERAGGIDHLDVRIEGAIVVGELEASLERQRLAAPDVRNPDERATDAGAGTGDPSLEDLRPAHAVVDSGANDRIRGNEPIRVDGPGDAAAGDCNHPVRLRRCGDDRRTRSDTIGGVAIAGASRCCIISRAGNESDQDQRICVRQAKHQLLVEVRMR
jgi:hypothetical protein